MHLTERNDHIERIFLPWRFPLGKVYDAYKGRVYRLLNFMCASLEVGEVDCALYGKKQEVEDRIAIAACFHDNGIWLDKTVDYLEPSKGHASEWLKERQLTRWESEIGLMFRWALLVLKFRGSLYVKLRVRFRNMDFI
jgi:hypothetical protein